MAGSLIKIDEEIVTSAVASVTLGGTDWDSSYDVYMIVAKAIQVNTNGGNIRPRVTASGTGQSGANYDNVGKQLRNNSTFNNSYSTNNTSFAIHFAGGTGTGKENNFIYYLFNFNNASEYSFITFEETGIDQNGFNIGNQGSGVHTVAQANDGMEFFSDTGSIDSGVFTMYGLKK